MGLLPSSGTTHYACTNLAGKRTEARIARGLRLVPERRELFAEMSV
jgi:branched-chain amino acid transport system ATP-binding protein